MNTIAWIGFCQSLFAAILMFTKKESAVADKILSGWLFLLSIDFLTCGIDYELFNRPMLSSSFLLFNPALYLYISSLTRPHFRLSWWQLLHLLPFVVFEITAYIIREPFTMFGFFLIDANFIYRILFAAATLISWLVYNPLSLIEVHRHRMHLKNERSTIEKNESLGWVLSISIFYVVYCIIAFILAALVLINDSQPLLPHIYNYAVLLFMVYVLSAYGLRQQKLPVKLLVEPETEPYQNSILSKDTKLRIRHIIIDYMEKKKAYLNPDLNMEMLSVALKTPKHQLTEVLSTEIGKNFFQFVNAYRVEAVKKMLCDPHNKFSIEAIGYECGFTSKSSFFTVFKSITGQTPQAYRKQHSPS